MSDRGFLEARADWRDNDAQDRACLLPSEVVVYARPNIRLESEMLKIKARCTELAGKDHGNQAAAAFAFNGTHLDNTAVQEDVTNVSISGTALGDPKADEIDFAYGDEVEVTFKLLRRRADIAADRQKSMEEAKAKAEQSAQPAAANEFKPGPSGS